MVMLEHSIFTRLILFCPTPNHCKWLQEHVLRPVKKQSPELSYFRFLLIDNNCDFTALQGSIKFLCLPPFIQVINFPDGTSAEAHSQAIANLLHHTGASAGRSGGHSMRRESRNSHVNRFEQRCTEFLRHQADLAGQITDLEREGGEG
eukprot:c29432_g1_i1 orf=231-674(+)